ncbi:AMP-binding protein [Pseudochryseolinea flava]|uniref:AMP-dependent synthetase n=1 Tax=Pseudochryseolinea flava TaxID=2059302 RepID=A0A364Y844_9BACT|nr:AMP-binding protein [Pseudochryseolinea flava]RAW03286.1 AMP-dependent synthetase [Pseudochryseolinea flava]
MTTPLDFFYYWESQTPQQPFLHQPINGQWKTYTYSSAGIEARRLASALRALKLPSKTAVAILSKNCAHWFIADLAIMMADLVSVPIYPTLSAASVKPIVEHSESKVIFIGKLDQYAHQRDGIPEHVMKISFPDYGPHDGISWNDFVRDHEPLKENRHHTLDTLATIMYSSGTTGTPKGVMLTYGALGHVGERVRDNLKLVPSDTYFSYLPLSHIAERALVEMVVYATGCSVSFSESLEKFAANLEEVQPTVLGGVPRIWSKFQEGVLKKISQKKLDTLLSIPLVSALVKRSIRKKLGMSRIRVAVSGAAPTPVSLIAWFQRIGVNIWETYGMTENTAYSHSNWKKIKLGTVGSPWPDVETKIDGNGEILIRHKALMTGYYKDLETTAAVFTNDGFLRTGDLGSIDDEGFLTITGRVKDQFKTDKAKFIAPAKIEMMLAANKDIDQVCVVGTGIPQPVALVVLSDLGKLKPKDEIIRSLTKTVGEVNPTLEEYEVLKKIIVMRDAWTIENNFLTPTLKVKRNAIENIYVSTYPTWYAQNGLVIFE